MGVTAGNVQKTGEASSLAVCLSMHALYPIAGLQYETEQVTGRDTHIDYMGFQRCMLRSVYIAGLLSDEHSRPGCGQSTAITVLVNREHRNAFLCVKKKQTILLVRPTSKQDVLRSCDVLASDRQQRA